MNPFLQKTLPKVILEVNYGLGDMTGSRRQPRVNTGFLIHSLIMLELNNSSFSWGAPPANPGGPQAPLWEPRH